MTTVNLIVTKGWAFIYRTQVKSKIDLIQQNGIWDCTLCGECTAVCPQNIDPKMDIMNLRSKSAKYGYMDPNFGSFGGGPSF